jgi:hypothetical protein
MFQTQFTDSVVNETTQKEWQNKILHCNSAGVVDDNMAVIKWLRLQDRSVGYSPMPRSSTEILIGTSVAVLYQVTPCNTVILNTRIIVHLTKKLPVLYEQERSAPCSQHPHLDPVLSQTNPVHVFKSSFLKIHCNAILRFLWLQLCMKFSFRCACYMFGTSHLIYLFLIYLMTFSLAKTTCYCTGW